ncbi:uncharacterized protein LOC129589690 [Paramacrobiotus metropolitanus]|uniref:uncharacterized protein LOC129589690 n=1 Tax=Paramacrobiotus metropolitanus TaxID=2943436 RepID=UPI002446156A|nr:uncharacterized protein LOC129589690 [Paramacrobiotus metropolitanus]
MDRKRKFSSLLLSVLSAILKLIIVTAVSDEGGNVEITTDLFYQPGNFSDASAEAGTGPRLWPNRTAIPYYISSEFDKPQQDLITKALRIMEKKTNGCISFTARTDEWDYIYFKRMYSGGCESELGHKGSYQYIYLAVPSLFSSADCMYIGKIQHEVMHALGFDHEHERPDRDQYVDIRRGNIDSDEYERNFAISGTMYTFGTKYDYNSILHYGTFHGIQDVVQPCIVPKKGLIVRMGQTLRMSSTDVAKIMIAYKCPLTVIPVVAEAAISDEFPNFSLEPMTDDECCVQFNRYCNSDITTPYNCAKRRDYRIMCQSKAPVDVLERMTLAMTAKPLRLVSISAEEELISKSSFTPIQRQVLKLQLWNCTTDRVTSRLQKLNFSNLLHFELYNCYNLDIEKADFGVSPRLRIILFLNSTIYALQIGSFMDLPSLQILSLEALSDSQKYYNFVPAYRTHLRNLHCSCEFAWYRSWWRENKRLRLRTEAGELYSFEGPSAGTFFSSDEFTREDLYHPINCSADPFPLSTEWINYYTQTDYSVNEPNCNASTSAVITSSNATQSQNWLLSWNWLRLSI